MAQSQHTDAWIMIVWQRLSPGHIEMLQIDPCPVDILVVEPDITVPPASCAGAVIGLCRTKIYGPAHLGLDALPVSAYLRQPHPILPIRLRPFSPAHVLMLEHGHNLLGRQGQHIASPACM